MDTINCLRTRRSVRLFKEDPIPEEILNKIIEAAEYAPSSKNTKPWEYFILRGKEKAKICDIVVEEYPKRGKPFRKREDIQPKAQALDTKSIEKFRDATVMTNVGSILFIRKAPVLVLVFNKAPYTAGEENVINEIDKEALLAHTVEIESCSNFVLSILLAAHDYGLGACWIADANFCRYKIKKYLGTKNDLVAGVVLGYSKQSIPPKKIEIEKISYWTED
ncbi:nitroreductase family protein [Patescibacteria group bacterium]|nr:nitroreductase family protein [Patescibacteria group bacterium]